MRFCGGFDPAGWILFASGEIDMGDPPASAPLVESVTDMYEMVSRYYYVDAIGKYYDRLRGRVMTQEQVINMSMEVEMTWFTPAPLVAPTDRVRPAAAPEDRVRNWMTSLR